MLNKNFKYIKFILTKLRDDLYLNGFEIKNTEAEKIIKFLEESDDILRDIFLLTGFKKYIPLCSYLIFVYKKLEDKDISYNNLTVNIDRDTEYLKKIIISSLKIQNPNSSSNTNLDEGFEETNNQTEIFSLSDTQSNFEEWEVSDDITPGMFSVGDIEKDIVTEEFSEDEIQQLYTPVEREEEEEFIIDEENSGTDEQEEKITYEQEEFTEMTHSEVLNSSTDLSEFTEHIDIQKEESFNDNTDIIENNFQKDIQEEIPEDEEEFEPEETWDDANIEAGNGLNIESRNEIINEENLFSETDEQFKEEELNEEEPSEQQVTGSYLSFLNDLSDRHDILIKEFYNLTDSENEKSRTEKNEITLSIINKTSELKDISDRKNFEIISNIYTYILNYFKNSISIPFNPEKSDINTFSKSLDGIMNFLNDENVEIIEEVLNEFEFISDKIEKERVKATEERERKELEKERERNLKQTEESKINTEPIENETDEIIPMDERKYMIKLLKYEITGLEKVFNSIYDIKTDYPVYEAQRQLSKTFNILKKILSISRRINISKLGRLAEATYTFIKFVQSYRLDPFTDTIRQIFNYIIYNFKLITLDKPTKDYEEFVKHLNNTVTIFN
ncbi:MAG TPA: hypothetical protein DEP28_04635, partial [Bacteroidetes bacterium]|nr:hypothetical protein [Bacteroidota bacterium]